LNSYIYKNYLNRIKTGGGDSNDIGAIESRRQDANDLLNDAKDALGSEKYLDLVNLLKALNSRVLSIPEVRDGFSKLLESDHNSLFERFETFLPKKFRS
jgi:histone deacetylase complex regulatory component SIN3